MSEGSNTPQGVNEITDGTAVIHIRNLDLAICLLSVGVALRKDPPYTHHKLKNGAHQWTFNFEPKDSDGQFLTMDLVEAFKQDMKFIEENPVHPMTFAMCALKNRELFKKHMSKSVPYVSFRAQGGATLFVKEGSRKHRNAVAKGMVQV
jgi:hypothetical protein